VLGCTGAFGVVLAGDETKDQKIKQMEKDRKERDDAPAVGSEAPNFKLKTADGKSEIELTSLRGKKPVVLVFGSYT
jgi:peroxiredoxin